VGGQSAKQTTLYATVYAIMPAQILRVLWQKKTKKFCACKDQRLPGRRGLIRTAGSGPRPVAGAHVAQVSHGARPHPFFPDTRSLFSFSRACGAHVVVPVEAAVLNNWARRNGRAPLAGCAQQEEIDDSKKKEGIEVWHLKMKKDVYLKMVK